MFRKVHLKVHIVKGTTALGKAFGDVQSLSAAYIFYKTAKMVLQIGGGPGRDGTTWLTEDDIEKALN